MSDVYTLEGFQRDANKSALLAARIAYNEKIAPFVKHSRERLAFAENDIEKIIKECAQAYHASEDYVRTYLRDVIAVEIKVGESDEKRLMEKGLGVEKEHVNENLENAGKSYPGFGGEKSDTGSSGVGVSGDNGGEEATTEPDSQSLSFDTDDGLDAGDKGFGGGPENPPSETKDPSEKPIEVEETDVSYHNGPVLEEEAREPDKEHDLNKDTFKWTKVQDRIVVDRLQKKK